MTLRNQAQALDIVIARELPAPGAPAPTEVKPTNGPATTWLQRRRL